MTIDLGSTYTKIAVRRDWNQESELLHDLPLASPEVDFCIPSVVARVDSGGATRWKVGAEAAAEHPAEGTRIYRYWKARLFSADPATPVGDGHLGESSEPYGGGEAEEVAIRFFLGVRERLERSELGPDLERSAVRVCVPKIDVPELEARVVSILEAAGWRAALGRAIVYEPESNACGILTRGRNSTWFPPAPNFMPRPGRSMHLARMLEPEGLLQALRRMTGSFGVLVIDIGGFTTDFGYVEFDTSFSSSDWHRPKIVQQSYEIGIRELDEALYRGLDDEAREAVRGLSSAEWEVAKMELYRGGRAVVTSDGGGRVSIGGGEESTAAALGDFARRVIDARDAFCRDFVRGPINAQTLTGGGSMIPAVRAAVVQALSTDDRVHIHDLLDGEEPRRTLTRRARQPEEVTGEEIAARARHNQELVRGASALGGSSVFFE